MQSDQFEYAGFWSRVGAGIIDLILLLIVTVPLSIAFYGRDYFTEQNTSVIAGPADLFINYLLPAACTILFWWHKQATPGKMAISARIVDAKTGANLTVGQAIGRYFAYFIAILPFFLGLLWIAFDPRKQGWHDKLAGTVVIRPRHRGPDPVRFGDKSQP